MIAKPKLRKEAEIELLSKIQSVLSKASPFQSCLNCDNFNEQTEICKVWNARPPAKVIAFSCGTDKYDDNEEIPF